ncbi:hypothetical protein [Flammeovirga sp. OC4]|uniref:hypothetical protein n=1 Tax=Flammeovirga sp. OC4 TaxID=1382345 RepID=UPI0012E058B2|nr:hypothetical protein [Flammeovirga sp. OC4]
MRKVILLSIFIATFIQSFAQIDANSLLYFNIDSDLSKSLYISTSGSFANEPRMFFHLPYVGTSGNAMFEWDADDSGSRKTIYRFNASSDPIFVINGWNDGSMSDLWFGDDNNDKFYISDNGNIGLGTKQPSAKLDIKGGDLYLGEKVYTNGQRRQMRIYGFDNSSKFYGALHSNYDDYRRTFDISTNNSTNQIKIDASANENGRITILPGDNVGVGIGTLVTGSHKLAVEGSIGAREIKVEASGWSDFVFENGYELRTLEEVEQYISEKGHLPEIPSKEEVTVNGINLGEMNAKLLQKIEELTLYLIEQNKENQEQRKLIKELQKEVSALKGQ